MQWSVHAQPGKRKDPAIGLDGCLSSLGPLTFSINMISKMIDISCSFRSLKENFSALHRLFFAPFSLHISWALLQYIIASLLSVSLPFLFSNIRLGQFGFNFSLGLVGCFDDLPYISSSSFIGTVIDLCCSISHALHPGIHFMSFLEISLPPYIYLIYFTLILTYSCPRS